MNEKEWNVLFSCPLFAGCDKESIPDLIAKSDAKEAHFAAGDVIPFRDGGQSRIGILMEGKASVYAAEDERCPLNRLTPGSLFGVSTLYSDFSADTFAIAETEAKFLFLEEEGLSPIWENPVTRRNLVSFLTGRIRFLTEKIASFTAPSATVKLARFLYHHRESDGRVKAIRSMAELARSLNLGRASLYRALEKLEEDGLLKKEGKDLFIPDPESMNSFLSR